MLINYETKLKVKQHNDIHHYFHFDLYFHADEPKNRNNNNDNVPQIRNIIAAGHTGRHLGPGTA